MKNGKKLSPGQIRITPLDNRMLEMPPFANTAANPPSWYKRIMREKGSLRTCAGVLDYLSTGVTLPLWTNAYFRPNREHGFWEHRLDNYDPPAQISMCEGFHYESTGECPVTSVRKVENAQYPKIVNPWRFETPKGWSTLVLPPYWEPNNQYDILPAIVHTDFYHQINVVLNIKTDESFKINYGTPILHLIPFERKYSELDLILGDESEWKYVSSGGLGQGRLIPSDGNSAGPYRRTKNKIDAELSNSNKKFWFGKNKL